MQPEFNKLFQEVGLSPDRLREVARLAETMSRLIKCRLAQLKYREEADIRGIPIWPADKPVLLIAGQSGTGKTWQLGRLLVALVKDRQIGTLVPVPKTTEAILARAARDVWQDGLGETSEKTLSALTHFYREMAPGAAEPWLTIAIDDVQDVDLARDLVRQGWADWGTRLVLTTPMAVARALELTDGNTVHVHNVGEFSVDELDAMLKQGGRRWADLPADLKRQLRSPVLAGLFMELPFASVQAAPQSQYEDLRTVLGADCRARPTRR